MNLKITHGTYPSGTEFFKLSGTLKTGKRIRENFPTEIEAIRQRNRLLSNNSISLEEDKQAEQAIHILKASGIQKSIIYAVQWFVKHYSENQNQDSLKVWVERFLQTKIDQNRSENTIIFMKTHLNHLLKTYGTEIKPNELNSEQLNLYIQNNSSKSQRYRILKGFFNYLCNNSKNTPKLKKPPLTIEENPFNYILKPDSTKQSETKIFNNEEIKKLIIESHKSDLLAYFILSIYSGLRPMAELQKLLRQENPWNYFDLNRNLIHVPREWEKTRRRVREIEIQPNLIEWLKYIKENNLMNLRVNHSRHFRIVKRKVLTGRKSKLPNISRHTFISHLLQIRDIDSVCFQCTTSHDMIRTHYFRLPTQSESKEFWSLTPEKLNLI